MKEYKSTSTNETELKQELISLSLKAPSRYFEFWAVFGKVTIVEHDRQPEITTARIVIGHLEGSLKRERSSARHHPG